MDRLEEERHELLSELDRLGHQGPLCSALQARYNQIIEDEYRPSLPDPLTVLPSEICNQIFQKAVDNHSRPTEQLLLLSAVSTNWCQYLVSVPSLWTMIDLHESREDTLVSVATCLTLSRRWELHLNVGYILNAKEAFYELVVPHASRIAYIAGGNKLLDFVQMLGRLPALKCINYTYGSISGGEIDNRLSQLLEDVPSLVSPRGMMLTAKVLQHPHSIKFTYIRTELSFHDVLRMLSSHQHSSQLKPSVSHLELISLLTDINDDNIPALLLDLDTLYVCKLSSGYSRIFSRYFQNIHRLTITIATEDTLGELFEALRYSHKVRELSLIIIKEVESIPKRSDYPTLTSLTRLHFWKDVGRHRFNLGTILGELVTICPCLQEITTLARMMTATEGIRHLARLKDLRKFQASTIDEFTQVNDGVYFDRLESLNLGTCQGLDYSNMQLRNLRELVTSITGVVNPQDISTGMTSGSFSHVIPMSYAIPPSSFTTLVKLTISFSAPVDLQLQSLSALEKLSLGEHTSRAWAGDILEQLVVNPKICSNLSKIDFKDLLLEWDLLLLALLRRNFLCDQTISKIREVAFPYWLPPRLLSPISQLLGGRFVSDLDLNTFSLERITQLLCHTPSKPPRCTQCSYKLLEECKDSANPSDFWLKSLSPIPQAEWARALENGLDYPLAITSPDPSLPNYMTQWLAGKWDRRRGFVDGLREAQSHCQDIGSCFSFPSYSTPIITGFTMEGLNLDDSSDEHDD